MNDELLERLLLKGEGDDVDYKREQYLLTDDDKKSELIKDVLAMANSWHDGDSYILVGVEESASKKGEIRGINAADHLEDANLQQLINSKTNTPVKFAYNAYHYDGQEIGLLSIAAQDRPIFLKKRFGKLNAEEVYVRRSTSTDIAKPDEIAKMGAAKSFATQIPTLELEWASPKNEPCGTHVKLRTHKLRCDFKSIKDYGVRPNPLNIVIMLERDNNDYYREMAEYIVATSKLGPTGICVRNTSGILLQNVRVVVAVEIENGLRIYPENSFPRRPRPITNRAQLPPGNALNKIGKQRREIDVEYRGNILIATATMQNVQPRALVFSDELVAFSADSSTLIKATASIYADNLPNPVEIGLTIDLIVEPGELDSSVMIDNLVKKEQLYRFP